MRKTSNYSKKRKVLNLSENIRQRFGITTYNPDHSQDDLLIETKFIRKNTTPSVATSGIAEDMTKVPKAYGLLFIVYDPERQIYDDDTFIRDYENRREECYVRIYR